MSAPITGANRPAEATRPAARVPIGELVFALLMLALGVFALVGVFSIHVPVGVTVGPTVFPIFVSVTLLASAAAVLVGVLRGRRAEVEDSEDIDPDAKTDWLTLVKIVGALIAHLLLIDVIGWAPAAAVLFGLVAWSLGAKRWWMAFLIGLVVGLAVQIVFGGFLGLSLPWGPALGWLGGML
ncbi:MULTISPECIES: tripartite tricarboxylate transporter TctB family protein [unclassified Microbacterium]|uniref:tripartite tricarboxylate transporter TctB family protein n=1 Tax=unclassified Microbacterium TaxID=2609290 RepID=UPI0012F813F7|nr:tripartite tricarboxylate transporter TctB family protein [Microbacterium sp. MAH-37]MVQ40814.1 tripartite tricarboxylate transporter TctB family protein [Microbacterium sp. MAH-37]